MSDFTDAERLAVYRAIYAHFQRAVDQFAAAHHYDLIITAPERKLGEKEETAENPRAVQAEIMQRRVQFTSRRIDITPHVVEQMNRNWKAMPRIPDAP